MAKPGDENVISIDNVLDKLEEWRHFPGYRFEPRVDVLFGLVLRSIIKEEFKKSLQLKEDDLEVIPEFPLRFENVLDRTESKDSGRSIKNLSVKVDFAVISPHPSKKQIFLVELKTDNNSIKGKQLCYMEQAKSKAGTEQLLQGVIELAIATKEQHHKFKYAHLIWKLNNIGCIGPGPSGKLTEYPLNPTDPISRKDYQNLLNTYFEKLRVSENWRNTKENNGSIECVLIYPGGKISNSVAEEIARHDVTPIDFSSQALNGVPEPLKNLLSEIVAVEAGYTNPWKLGTG